MATIFSQLKRARESRGMSLEDVSEATNINLPLLEAIDKGQTDMLPQAYVRAFLREYAMVVGLDPDEIMEEYDRSAPPEPAAPEEKPPEPVVPREEPPTETRPKEGRPALTSPATLALLAAAAGIVIILYWNFTRSGGERSVDEPGSRSDLQEQSAGQVPAGTPADDRARNDSLTLVGRTSDTVWVQVIIDGRDSLDYILRPGAVRSWKAGESFRVSIGRPDAITFALNSIDMGPLGTLRRIVRDSLIDRSTLESLQEQN